MNEHPVLWRLRTRWAAVGAAVAVVLGTGGIAFSGASNAQLTPSEQAISPCRIMDTRPTSTVGPRSTPLASGATHTIQVTGTNGNCTLPADTASVTLNLTVVQPGANGYITVYPAGPSRPTASNLNYTTGQSPEANLVEVAVSSSGQVSFFASGGPVHLIADIASYTVAARLSSADLALGRWDRDQGVEGAVATGTSSNSLAFDGNYIWVGVASENKVKKIDPVTSTVLASVTVGTNPQELTFDGTYLWVVNTGSDSVSKVNPATNTVLATVAVGSEPRSATFGAGSIWVTNFTSDTVSRIQPTTNAVIAEFPVGPSPTGLAFDGSNLWVATLGNDRVSSYDTTTYDALQQVTMGIGADPQELAFDGVNIWAANSGTGNVKRIRGTFGVTATIATGSAPNGLAFDGSNMWVANISSDDVVRISGDAVDETIPGLTGATDLVFDGRNLWVARSGLVTKLRPR
ncbi:MAG: hypothetical protein ACKOYM_11530 [Actinomycetes bacterium]